MGHAEVAELFGITGQVLGNWIKRGKFIPDPYVRLKMGPIWRTEDIVNAWIDYQSSKEHKLNEEVVKLRKQVARLKQQVQRLSNERR